jgi:hypothetical protein
VRAIKGEQPMIAAEELLVRVDELVEQAGGREAARELLGMTVSDWEALMASHV